jgi:hypothetical protein
VIVLDSGDPILSLRVILGVVEVSDVGLDPEVAPEVVARTISSRVNSVSYSFSPWRVPITWTG